MSADRNVEKASAFVQRIAAHHQAIKDRHMEQVERDHPVEYARALRFVRGAQEAHDARRERTAQRETPGG